MPPPLLLGAALTSFFPPSESREACLVLLTESTPDFFTKHLCSEEQVHGKEGTCTSTITRSALVYWCALVCTGVLLHGCQPGVRRFSQESYQPGVMPARRHASQEACQPELKWLQFEATCSTSTGPQEPVAP